MISTHLPPPVITESTADFAATTHILCCSCGMYFSAAASSENDHGSMNLASNTAPLPRPGRRASPPSTAAPVLDMPLDVDDDLPGIDLIPAPIKVLGDRPKLDNEVAREVLRLDLTPLLPPQPHQGDLIVAHDDPGVGTAYKRSAVCHFSCRKA